MFEALSRNTFSMPVCMTGLVGEGAGMQLRDQLSTIGFENILEHTYNFFDLASAHELSHMLSQKADPTTCIIAHIHRTNREAQNALLKNLEEHGGNIALIFIIPQPDIFLPTIHSRCYALDIRGGEGVTASSGEEKIDWHAWLGLSPAARMEQLAKLKGELTVQDLRQGADTLEKFFYEKMKNDPVCASQLKTLQKVRTWLESPNPSVGMVGEYLSLVVGS